MKVKHVLKDLGPKTLVQIYKPSSVSSGYVERFLKAYPAEEINYLDYTWVKSDLDEEVDHVEYGHYYTTDEMVSSCNIYLKADAVKIDNKVNEEKPSTTRIDYSDLEKKWNIFRKQLMIHDDFEVKAWLVSAFLHALAEGTLIEMEDKDLS